MKILKLPKYLFGVWGRTYAGEWEFFGAAVAEKDVEVLRKKCHRAGHDQVRSVPFFKGRRAATPKRSDGA